jgi:hypothetical protein
VIAGSSVKEWENDHEREEALVRYVNKQVLSPAGDTQGTLWNTTHYYYCLLKASKLGHSSSNSHPSEVEVCALGMDSYSLALANCPMLVSHSRSENALSTKKQEAMGGVEEGCLQVTPEDIPSLWCIRPPQRASTRTCPLSFLPQLVHHTFCTLAKWFFGFIHPLSILIGKDKRSMRKKKKTIQAHVSKKR